MFLKKDGKGYYRLYEWVNGKAVYRRYIGKHPEAFLRDLKRAKGVAPEFLALAGSLTEAIAAHKRAMAASPKLSGEYRTIVVDPPWPMTKILRDVRPNQADFDYPVMALSEIEAMPIKSVACSDAHLYFWTTQRFLPGAIRILEIWGFTYVFTMVWRKSGGFQPIGLPQYNCEFILFGRKGGLPFLDTKQFPTCFEGARREHSRKPAEFYELVKRVSPGPRLDCFSREVHDGFDSWGNETAKFGI